MRHEVSVLSSTFVFPMTGSFISCFYLQYPIQNKNE